MPFGNFIALDSLLGHARALASLAPAQILFFTGTLRDSGEPATALYAGNGSNLEFIVASLFANVLSKQKVADVSAPLLHRALARLPMSADIVVAERPPLWALLGGRVGTIRMPAWIRQELRLAAQPAQTWTLGRHLEREVQRQIRRHQYRLVLSDAAADKTAFFADFYQPYIRARHGSSAVTVEQRKFLQVASGATLAQLFAGTSWTAGMLLQRCNDTLRFGWFGSRQNPPSPGASEVLDVLCIKAAAEHGVRCINFGNSRPSLIDGVVRYKMKFGAQFVMPRYPQTSIQLEISTDRAALRDWLTSRQFLCNHRNTLAVAGYSAGDPAARVEFRSVGAP